MKTAPISAVKASFSEYIDAVRRGDEVVITDRGRPVARLVPVEGGKAREGRLSRLVREGIIAPPRKRRRSGKLSPPPGKKASGVLAALLEERAGGR